MSTTKQYLDLNGLKYLLSKLSYTKAAEPKKFLTGIAEKNGVIEATSAELTKNDIPAIGTPTSYSAATALTGSVATITNTITRDGDKADLTASFKLGVSGDLTLARDAESGALTIGYAESVKGVKADGYLTLDGSTKLLDINADKIQGNTGGTKRLLAAKEYVDEKVAEAIAGGSDISVTDTNNGDLEFADESGNVVMRLSNGHIKTKNFDSETAQSNANDIAETIAGHTQQITEHTQQIATHTQQIAENTQQIEDLKNRPTTGGGSSDISVTDTNNGDLEFADESGNVIMRLSNGHIKTKNFDSETAQSNSNENTIIIY